VQNVVRMPTSRFTPKEVIGGKALGPTIVAAKGSKASEFVKLVTYVPNRRESKRSVGCVRRVVALRKSELRRVASEFGLTPKNMLEGVFGKSRRAARLWKALRIAERLGSLGAARDAPGAARRGRSGPVPVAFPSRFAPSFVPPRCGRSVESPEAFIERRRMASVSSSWRSLHDVVGSVLSSCVTTSQQILTTASEERGRNNRLKH